MTQFVCIRCRSKDQISWTYVYGLDEKYAYKEVENNNGQSNGYIQLCSISTGLP